MGTVLCFSATFSIVGTKMYWAFKKEDVVNMKSFVRFSFL